MSNKKYNLNIMRKFIANVKFLNEIGKDGLQKCYGGYLDISFINNTKVDKTLFNNNVRDTTFNNTSRLSELMKNKAFSGVYKTLEKIENGASPILMFELNQGGSLMCESIKETGNTDEYEITLTEDFHGFGNGQQTLSTAWYYRKNNKDIKPNTLIFFKFFESYKRELSQQICVANNTNVRINNMDLISNSWNSIAYSLEKKGIHLKHKLNKDFIKPEGLRVIDITEDNFYNVINAYQKLQPWKSGNDIIDNSLLEGMTPELLIKLDDLRLEFNDWFLENYSTFKEIREKNEKKFSTLREKGISKSFFIACHKLHYDPILTNNEFFNICLESFVDTIDEFNSITNSKYFNTFEKMVKLGVRIKLIEKKEKEYSIV